MAMEEEEEEDVVALAKFCSEEKWPMELPRWLELLLRFSTWIAIRRDGYPRRAIQKLLDVRVPARTKAGVAAEDVVIDRGTGLWVRVFKPVPDASSSSSSSSSAAAAAKKEKAKKKAKKEEEEEIETMPLIFYFHGGGFTLFSAGSAVADAFGRYLAAAQRAVVVSVDYRKTPAARHPAAYDDARAAVRWAAAELSRRRFHTCPGPLAGADAGKCFFVGESAGGNIAHHAALAAAAETEPVTVKGVLALFPFFGSEERTAAELRLGLRAIMLNFRMCDAAWADFLPEGASRDHPAANPTAAAEDPPAARNRLPPLLVTLAEYDCLKEHQARFVEARRRAGQPVRFRLYPGAIHCFHVFPHLRLTALFRSHLARFFRSCLLAPDP